MEIPGFRRHIEISDLDHFYKSRLSQDVVLWPEQAIPLLGYMCWPNDPKRRDQLMRTVRSWPEGSVQIPNRLRRIQHKWLRVADVFHLYFDLVEGNHQERRGGPSIGKAVTLAEANAKSRGTGASSLWDIWAFVQGCRAFGDRGGVDLCRRTSKSSQRGNWEYGLPANQFMPFPLAMMMPDLVLAVALGFERFGLSQIPHGQTNSTLNPDTLWRIPSDINVMPVAPPARKIRTEDLAVLNPRRAATAAKPGSTRLLQLLAKRRPSSFNSYYSLLESRRGASNRRTCRGDFSERRVAMRKVIPSTPVGSSTPREEMHCALKVAGVLAQPIEVGVESGDQVGEAGAEA